MVGAWGRQLNVTSQKWRRSVRNSEAISEIQRPKAAQLAIEKDHSQFELDRGEFY
jgi:hypothetical protein